MIQAMHRLMRHFRQSVKSTYVATKGLKALLDLGINPDPEDDELTVWKNVDLVVEFLNTDEALSAYSTQHSVLPVVKKLLRIPGYSPTRFVSSLPVRAGCCSSGGVLYGPNPIAPCEHRHFASSRRTSPFCTGRWWSKVRHAGSYKASSRRKTCRCSWTSRCPCWRN